MQGIERLAVALCFRKVRFKFWSKTVEFIADKIADLVMALVFL